MTRYAPQGTGENRLPHLLTARIDHDWSGVLWGIQCPYEGVRDCGVVEECSGTEEDVAKWGCARFPVEPPTGGRNPFEMTVAERDAKKVAWDDFCEAMANWRDETHDGYAHHHTTVCWYAEVAIPGSDFEPEHYLSGIPKGTLIDGPMKVLVGYEGSDEDTEPRFKLWEEPTDDPS